MTPLQPSAKAQGIQAFDEHWFATTQWTRLDQHSGLTRWQVRAGEAGPRWLVLGASAQTSPWEVARVDREYAMAPCLDSAWALIPLALLHAPRGPLLILQDGGAEPLSRVAPGPLSIERFLRLAVATTAALGQMHARGIVHRDIRPENLLLDEDGRVRFTGFAFARVGAEKPEPALQAPDASLAYISPEQASQQSGPASQRSDLYALGVVFFQQLTGHLPFAASEASQWLHQHMAVPAPPVGKSRPAVPTAIAELVARLLRKQPAERPHSAKAVEAELHRCLNEWREWGKIHHSPAHRSGAEAANYLVGREAELQSLAEAIARLAEGLGGAVLIQGEAGIGKTALVRHLRRHQQAQTLFATGKCEQARHNLPYGVLANVLSSLFTRLTGESPEDVQRWGQRFREAIGEHGHMVARIAPEIAWLTGALPPQEAPPVGEARRHLHTMIRRLLTIIATPSHPLLLFLDDVQWIDSETLAFLGELSANSFDHLLIIAAYRDAGLGNHSDLAAFVEHCRKTAPHTLELRLQPLAADEIAILLGVELELHAGEHHLLANRLAERGQGNPLYVRQAIAAWRESIDLEPTARLPELLDDVAAMMASRLGRLPDSTLDLLSRLALLGNQTSLDDLAVASDASAAQLSKLLRPALEAGLIAEYRQGLAFTHDAIWESARARLPQAQRERLHLAFAQALLQPLAPDASADAVFKVAGQLLQVQEPQVTPQQRAAFIEVLMRAAHLAKASAAAATALGYVEHAARLLHGMPEQQPERVQAVSVLYTQCLILNADYQGASLCLSQLLQHTEADFERAELFRLQCEIHSLRGDYDEAVAMSVQGLASLGVDFPLEPSDAQTEAAWQALQEALDGRLPSAFEALPLCTDSRQRAVAQLLASIVIPGSFIHPNLMLMGSARLLSLALEHGMSASTVHGLAWLGVAIAQRYGAYRSGCEYTQVARSLAEQAAYSAARVSALVALDQVSAWTKPLHYALECAEQAYRLSMAQGSPSFACYANNHIVSDLLVLGAPIERMLRQIDTGLELARNLEFQDAQSILCAQAVYIRRLAGEVASTIPIPGNALMAERVNRSRMGPLKFWWALFEGLFQFLEGSFEQAAVHLDEAWAQSWSAPVHIHHIDLALFTVLNRAALQTATGLAQDFEGPLARLGLWAGLNPRYFSDRFALAQAEVARVNGKVLDALRHYEDAIGKATACGAVHIQGLAHEMEARCLAGLGLEVGAQTHLRLARDAWRRWGAHTLAEQLEAEHPFLRDPPGTRAESFALPARQQLDQVAIAKACQALSREIEPEALIKTLLSNVVVHAGATYSALLLLDEGNLQVEATGRASDKGIDILLRTGQPASNAAPLSLVLHAMRQREVLTIEGAEALRRFGDDAYLMHIESASVACLPLLKQNDVIGALYLENTLTPGVFEASRIEVLELLAAQAAISLTNARLYADLLAENERRRISERSLRLARSELDRTAQATILGELAASIAHEINQPLASILSNAGASVRWLDRATPQIEEALEGIRDILGEGQRAADIVGAIRALARQAPPERAAFAVGCMIRHVLALTQADVQNQQIDVETHLPEGLTAYGDRTLFQQVLYNLITNAMEAMQGVAAAERRLRIDARAVGSSIVVTVEDSGPGVAPAEQEKIFQAFYSTKAAGMGMGLAICSSIVAAHGGVLRATLGREHESLFFFTLPAPPDV